MLFKLVMVGEVGVGKSSLLLRYTDHTFTDQDIASIGADFKVKHMVSHRKKLKLQIWDTAGMEKFRLMTSSYFGGANGVVVVFDVTNRDSFANAERWIAEATNYSNQDQPLKYVFVGNKVDLVSDKTKREVATSEGESLAKKYNNSTYFEASAKSNLHVDELFECLASQLVEQNLNPLA
uniref:Uncharacterized protein n=1 Tax=Arcella intermedia TaxID=1963864 RepID=A0A6B2LLC2_9EUKA